MSSLVYETSTTSKRSLWPPEHADKWVLDAKDARLKLSDGRWYVDYCSALGAQTLGYSCFGNNLLQFQPAASLPWRVEQQFADQFCAAMDTEAVRFLKSGSDAVSCAVRLARAFTGRQLVAVFKQCYHGTGDWFGPALWTKGGVRWVNDEYRGSHQKKHKYLWILDFGKPLPPKGPFEKLAAIVVEPVPKSIELPPDGWLQHLREVCDAHKILLISDEIILGYRASLRGYLASIGVSADITCFGKAMGQGAAIAGTTGRQNILGLLEKDVHFSGTNNGEPLPLMLASYTLSEYKRMDVCEQLADRGLYLQKLLHKDGFETRGLPARFEVALSNRMSATRYLWTKNILFPGFMSISLAHTTTQLEQLVNGLTTWRESQS